MKKKDTSNWACVNDILHQTNDMNLQGYMYQYSCLATEMKMG